MPQRGSRLSERLLSRLQPSAISIPTLYSYLQNLNTQAVNALAEILEGLSHDSVNRFLLRERYDPKDLDDEIKLHIDLIDGTLSGDDTVIDKPYSAPFSTELIGYFWSGKHHRVVKGIQLITLYYTDVLGKSVPVNYRIYNKQEGKTKNDYLREMITEVLGWGLKPKMVTGDSWYKAPR